MSAINKKILSALDVFILVLHEIAEEKKISNEWERERLRMWKNEMKHKITFDESWPEGFEEDWE
jgi:hypothetical protein